MFSQTNRFGENRDNEGGSCCVVIALIHTVGGRIGSPGGIAVSHPAPFDPCPLPFATGGASPGRPQPLQRFRPELRPPLRRQESEEKLLRAVEVESEVEVEGTQEKAGRERGSGMDGVSQMRLTSTSTIVLVYSVWYGVLHMHGKLRKENWRTQGLVNALSLSLSRP